MRKLVAWMLVLCLVCSMAGAVAEGVQQIEIGKMSLQVPASLVYEEVEAGMNGMEAQRYACDDYHLIVVAMELEQVKSEFENCTSYEFLGNDTETTLHWSLQLFTGLENKAAWQQLLNAGGVLFDEREWSFIELQNGALFAHGAQGKGVFMMLTLNEGAALSAVDMLHTGLNVASTLQMEGAQQ